MTTDTKPMTGNHPNEKYYAAAGMYLNEYMNSIGVKEWSIPRWQSVVWYDGRVRVIPYKLILNDDKDKFIWELAGGFRSCYEYMFRKLDDNSKKFYTFAGLPI
jgi:hypothetical protein